MARETQKMALDASLLNTQHYKVRIKGKVEQSWEGVAPSPTPWCSSYRKGSLQVTLDYGRQLYFYLHLYLYMYIYINMNIYLHAFYIYIYVNACIHYQSKVFGHPLFLILKVLFLMKQVKHHNVFICYTKYKSSSITLTFV